ncbi:hypothetical protein GOODEAATRI_023259, partial [Goodea atripinnis]
LLTLSCAQMSLSPFIFYLIFFFALEFEHGVSGTQRGYIIFCPASPETSLLCLLSSPENLLRCGLPDDLPCHLIGSVGQSTPLLMNRPRTITMSHHPSPALQHDAAGVHMPSYAAASSPMPQPHILCPPPQHTAVEPMSTTAMIPMSSSCCKQQQHGSAYRLSSAEVAAPKSTATTAAAVMPTSHVCHGDASEVYNYVTHAMVIFAWSSHLGHF